MQQLSLPLEIPNSKSAPNNWFEQLLATLSINPEKNWGDRFGQSLRQYLQSQNIDPVKTLSLFSGGGGLDIGFHDAGFDIVHMVELESKYIQTLEKNSQPGQWLEGSQPICTDIRTFVPDRDLKVDFIIGGPPCQTFSAAGRRASGVTGTNESRGRLFEEYVRLLKRLQPKGFLFENVSGILGANQGQAWKLIQDAFRDVGYKLYFRILDAADYGVAQHRERLFIVGLQEGEYLFPYPTHGFDSLNARPYYSAYEAVQGADSSEQSLSLGGKFGHLLDNIPPGLNYSFYTQEMGYPHPIFSWRSKFSDFLYKADPDRPVRTIKAKGGQYTGPFSWENRKFSIAELKRLQTIPDDYQIIGSRQVAVEQIGNSVPPQLARILALSILDQALGKKLPFQIAYLNSNQPLSFRKRKRELTKIYAQKAKSAISELLEEGKIAGVDPSGYQCKKQSVRFLSMTTFSWTEEKVDQSFPIYLNYDLNSSDWKITASIHNEVDERDKFWIDICPCSGDRDWVLSTKSVRLSGKQLDKRLFTSLWKAFEEKVTEATGKADLVQLSGYYQYKPRISGIMSFCPQIKVDVFWHVIQWVTQGIGTGTQLSTKDLANDWDVNLEDILDYLKPLKSIGYEVRSHNTNPQIPVNYYLIPYAFPTLNPKSVQLHKNL
ncbi:DNA cytosine methyltransferase [Roseofilum capinflatum]|uniref:Cytosine-specific methyltransferase n=1 Tax=Roseofilum capinflatum BLCC-M114 TaxID=3022440 RepID=A0ABT7B8Y0_9CYAN|nr:DNA cytosine methyltransferase [Roseofilum capinflatum]MDJ1175054.1 DNA cytosine methyltransferase [Roseofilum capinflatum BLCC-M114]